MINLTHNRNEVNLKNKFAIQYTINATIARHDVSVNDTYYANKTSIAFGSPGSPQPYLHRYEKKNWNNNKPKGKNVNAKEKNMSAQNDSVEEYRNHQHSKKNYEKWSERETSRKKLSLFSLSAALELYSIPKNLNTLWF